MTTTRLLRPLALTLGVLAACGPQNNVPTDTGGSDASDAAPQGDGGQDASEDTAPSRCGTSRPDLGDVGSTEGLVIDPMGTIFFSQPGAIGRLEPGGGPDGRWAPLPAAASTVWGLTYDRATRRIFAGSPSARTIYVVSIDDFPPMPTAYLTNAGQPNGLTMGNDGALYYTDFGGGHVYRVAAQGMRTQVTATTLRSPNGLAFGPDGALYVVTYTSPGTIVRLELAGGMETARRMVASGGASLDGLAFDAMGRFYTTNNAAGTLLRFEADGSGMMTLMSGIRQAASVEFGVGRLPCTDIYVASSGTLARYEMGDTPGADVPWHRP